MNDNQAQGNYWLATIEKDGQRLTSISVFGCSEEEIEEFESSWDVIVFAGDWKEAGEAAFKSLAKHLNRVES